MYGRVFDSNFSFSFRWMFVDVTVTNSVTVSRLEIIEHAGINFERKFRQN